MEIDPRLRVFVGAGIYDSLNSCSANQALMKRIPRVMATRFTLECYASGHDFQRDPAVEPRFLGDMKAFIVKTVGLGSRSGQ
jgi:hypothetical protein